METKTRCVSGVTNTIIYVAVIGRPENLGQGLAHPAAFTSTNKHELIHKAIQKKREMESTGHSYSIFFGEMKHEVVQPVNYELHDLKLIA